MPVLPIAKLGNPVLRKVAARVDPRDIRTKEFQQLIDDMFETMLEEPGIGLAAPQVSQSIQLVVMGCEGEGGFPTTTLINPTIVYYGPQQVDNWEGCLSVDGFRGKSLGRQWCVSKRSTAMEHPSMSKPMGSMRSAFNTKWII